MPGRKKRNIVSAINVTPLTDVALVLLVIFLITTPFLVENAIDIDLPDANSSRRPAVNLVLNIQKDGKLFLDDIPVEFETLQAAIEDHLVTSDAKLFMVRADAGTAYRHVIRAIDIAEKAGIEKVGLITETPSP